jgi:hypothetical protein
MGNPFAAISRWIHSGNDSVDHIHIDYQPEVDLLFAWVGEPQAAENIEVEPGVYVRVLPNAKRVVGIEVLDCATRFRRRPEAINAAFAHHLLTEYSARALARV